MSLDINNSPYLQPLPRSNTYEGLGFGKHGLRKSKDKESWLKKIWSQVFTNKRSNATTAEHTRERAKQRQEKQKEREKEKERERKDEEEKEKERGRYREVEMRETRREKDSTPTKTHHDNSEDKLRDKAEETPANTSPSHEQKTLATVDERSFSAASVKLPPIIHSSESPKPKVTFALAPGITARPRAHSGRLRSERDSESGTYHRGNLRKDAAKSLTSIPAELANSPYLSSLKDKTLKELMLDKKKEFIRSKEHLHIRPRPTFDGTPYRNPLPQRHSSDFAVTTTVVDSWRRPRLPRGSSFTELEDRAKKMATKASKNNKIFTCDMPYPMDVYIRCSLRKRDWVEKFNPKIQNSAVRGGTSSKLEVQDDEDFEAICDQDIPAPWEEDYGIYAMMSRLVRHYPARFIWGGKGVNTLVLKNEVLVNHFTKAHHFSSKTGLTTNIRDLSWYIPGDPYEYFPRSYILGEDEREDFIHDFQLTVCMSILKWAVYQNTEKVEEAEVHKTEKNDEEHQEKVGSHHNIDSERETEEYQGDDDNSHNESINESHTESQHESHHESQQSDNFEEHLEEDKDPTVTNADETEENDAQDSIIKEGGDISLEYADGNEMKGRFNLVDESHESEVIDAGEGGEDVTYDTEDVNITRKDVDTNNNSNTGSQNKNGGQKTGEAGNTPRKKGELIELHSKNKLLNLDK